MRVDFIPTEYRPHPQAPVQRLRRVDTCSFHNQRSRAIASGPQADGGGHERAAVRITHHAPRDLILGRACTSPRLHLPAPRPSRPRRNLPPCACSSPSRLTRRNRCIIPEPPQISVPSSRSVFSRSRNNARRARGSKSGRGPLPIHAWGADGRPRRARTRSRRTPRRPALFTHAPAHARQHANIERRASRGGLLAVQGPGRISRARSPQGPGYRQICRDGSWMRGLVSTRRRERGGFPYAWRCLVRRLWLVSVVPERVEECTPPCARIGIGEADLGGFATT
ncbi:hypothetical protein DFH09DRAFT_2507 [Mycena vulgaris]|nr:hypothetical protein DFH09DRAFT_2507 [Mycena vulgaris]